MTLSACNSTVVPVRRNRVDGQNPTIRRVPGFPNYVALVSGTVVRIATKTGKPKWHELNPRACRQGYLYVDLCLDGVRTRKYVHAVVASAFLGPIPNGKQVDHIDDNKLNNCPSNLQYLTPEENRAKYTDSERGRAKLQASQEWGRTHGWHTRKSAVAVGWL